MEELNDRDRQVVIMRYGLADNEPKTLGEVAEILGLSRERVRQIEERAVNTLRKEAQKAGILEVSPVDLRTRKLHSAMRPRLKTNILGETQDNSPLARLLKKRAALVAQAKADKQKAKQAVSKKAASARAAKKTSLKGTRAAAPQNKKTAAKKAGKAVVKKAKPASKSVAKKSPKTTPKKTRSR